MHRNSIFQIQKKVSFQIIRKQMFPVDVYQKLQIKNKRKEKNVSHRYAWKCNIKQKE